MPRDLFVLPAQYVCDVEPAELVEARKRLAAYTARAGEEEPPGAGEEEGKGLIFEIK